jgi:DNA gyrase/topoisomerase IV subunit A
VSNEGRSHAEKDLQIQGLQAELTQLKAEKADLEVLLDTITRHADFIQAELERTVQALAEERHSLALERSLTETLRASSTAGS